MVRSTVALGRRAREKIESGFRISPATPLWPVRVEGSGLSKWCNTWKGTDIYVFSPRRILASAAVSLLSLAGLPTASAAQPPKDTTGTANGSELTSRWWQVASFDIAEFFADSTTGDNCRAVDLPARTVVMVAGTTGGASGERVCHIPSGSRVVLPAINNIWVVTDPAPGDSIGIGRKYNKDFSRGVVASATIDGQPAPLRRIRSSRFLLNATELFAFAGLVGDYPTVSDGYWLVVDLADGTHIVNTAGTADGFGSATTYTFHVG